jgi:hypothetical protein
MDDWPRAIEEMERLRAEGWLVVIKLMPAGIPFFVGDYSNRVFRRYACDLSWMRQETPGGTRRYIYAHPFGFGKTALEAVTMAAERAAELVKEWPVA